MQATSIKNPTNLASVDAAASNSQTTVRRAEAADLGFLLEQSKEFAKFYGTKISVMPDDDVAEKILLGIIQDHVVWISEVGGERTGFIGGWYVKHPLNPSITLLSEAFWWVKPSFRGGRSGAMLLDQFLEWGEASADWIAMPLEKNSPISESSLIKRGFVAREKAYLKEIV